MGQGVRDNPCFVGTRLVSKMLQLMCCVLACCVVLRCVAKAADRLLCLFTIMKTFSNILCKVVAARQPWHDLSSTSALPRGAADDDDSAKDADEHARFDILSGNCRDMCIPIPVTNLQAELVPSGFVCHYVDFVLGNCHWVIPAHLPLPLPLHLCPSPQRK